MFRHLLLLFLLAPAVLTGQYQLIEHSDISYLPPTKVEVDSLQRLNLVLPEGVDSPPLFIWIGGGAWSVVNRHQEMGVARGIAKEGIAVASIGHRLSSAVWIRPDLDHGVKFPAHVEDLAAAIKWLYDHADEYGYDQNRIFVGGFSSGAHLTAMVTLDPQYLEAHGLSTDIIKGLVPVSGGYDIPQYREVLGESPDFAHLQEQHVDAVFGSSKEEWDLASPTKYLDNLSAPWLMLADNDVHVYNTYFESYLRENSDFRDIEIIYVYSKTHAELWRDIAGTGESVYRDRIVRFIMNET